MAAKPVLKDWADAVKARDGKCRHCGSVDDLHAHHIKPKVSHPELSLDVENGLTLCYRCHKAEHERNRGYRIRPATKRLQRKTLERMIEELQAEVNQLTALSFRLRAHVRACERGACHTSKRRRKDLTLADSHLGVEAT